MVGAKKEMTNIDEMVKLLEDADVKGAVYLASKLEESEKDKAVELLNDNAIIIARDMKSYTDAFYMLKMAMKLRPDNPITHFNMGVLLSELDLVIKSPNALKEAEKEYREAIRLKSDYLEAHYNLAAILTDQGKYEEAEKEYREAIKINSNHAESHYNLGIILAGESRGSEAEKEFKKALELKPEFRERHEKWVNSLKEKLKEEKKK